MVGVGGLCLVACGGRGQGGPADGGGTGVIDPAAAGPVTYYKDVLPLVGTHCGGCHAPGGFAPFSLMSYDEARGHAGLVAAATRTGAMPPWPPAAGCGDFDGSRTLTPDEIAVFVAWEQAGAPAGEPAAAPLPTTTPGVDLGPPSATLDPGVSYQPNRAASDDYHCFLFDPGLGSAQDLIGFGVHPGTPQSVHHVLMFSVPPSAVAEAQARDAAEPGIGWTCFGGTGIGSRIDAPPTIGGWVPGGGASAFPAGTGIRLEAGTWIVVQVHYNLLAGADVADRTTVDLHYAATPVAKRALVLPIANQDFVVPAGMSATVAADLAVPPGSWALWGVAPHMHLRGTEIKLSIQHGAGDSTCAIDIPHWSFHWQGFYFYKQPLPVVTGDVVHLTCSFDNSAGSAPLAWGERTSDEMCLAFAYVTAAD